MSTTVHHRAIRTDAAWNLHAWQLAWDGNAVWDPPGTRAGDCIDFEFPQVPDARKLRFKYRSTRPKEESVWEPDECARQIARTAPPEIWTFESSPRILYREPSPPGIAFKAGDVLTFKVITRERFSGGELYAWNPYDSNKPCTYFQQHDRDEASAVSTFEVALTDWMTGGFHLKLMKRDADGNETWEPETANRVWRPSDGTSLWLKTGQCDVRSAPLALTPVPLEVLLPASVPAPGLTLWDVGEATAFRLLAKEVRPFSGSPLFQVARYIAKIYPQAAYEVFADTGESAPIHRPFPADPVDLSAVSRFALGASAWVKTFPTIASTVQLQIQPRDPSSFNDGLIVELAIGNSLPYHTVAAVQDSDGSWSASLPVAADTTTRIQLLPAVGAEYKPYDWIDTRRYFTPPSGAATYFTAEGVYGVASKGRTLFAEPSSRAAVMEAAFGSSIVEAAIFDSEEMPHGVTQVGGDVYFILHAPHAAWAGVVLVDDGGGASPTRREIPMTLTRDVRYWWCAVPGGTAKPGARYHFLLNDDSEVLDPAAREVLDREKGFRATRGCDPNDPRVSWSVILDVAAVSAQAHRTGWNTLDWKKLLIYEMHAQRFTDSSPNGLMPFDLLTDELQPTSRLGRPGYLRGLPVTAFEMMPVSEMSNAVSWGYDPAFYFAVDSHYGGAAALARFVNAAHSNGRAVLVDLVYNHSLGSPLMEVAPDVYRNGDYCGDRMNCGHPMVREFLRQAAIYMWRTFGLDGFRFDDTKTIAGVTGGWDFLQTLRWSIHAAATAEKQAWPFCIAENQATVSFDVASPRGGVMDAQWDIDEVYRIRDASYDVCPQSQGDDAERLRQEMNNPAGWDRPFYEAVRFAESHDMVSAQDPMNRRVAARPPFGLGLQMAKALAALPLLSNGVPMLFMGEEYGEVAPFSFDRKQASALNPQQYDQSPGPNAGFNTKVLDWFRHLMALRNDSALGLQGEDNYQVVQVGHRTVAFTCGRGQCLFAVVTFGTPDQQQNSAWLGLPAGSAYREILNSASQDFRVESELPPANGGNGNHITSGQILTLPYVGAVVLQRQ